MTDAAGKAALRRKAMARRDTSANREDAQLAAELLTAFLTSYRGAVVAGYLPIRSEIDPQPAMAAMAAHGPVGVPVITGRGEALRFRAWDPKGELVAGDLGTLQPGSGDWLEPEILIVPLVAFDRSGGRLGYGGGFYDRTLARLRAGGGRVLAVGFAYAAQELPDLPAETHDQPLDALVTEAEVLTFR